MELITTIPGGSIIITNDAEQATWEAENPAVGDFLINEESNKLVYMSDAGTVEEIPFGGTAGGGVRVLYDFANGANYTDVKLIGKIIVLFMLDGFPRFEVVAGPDPGFEFAFNNTTGTITIGTDFDDNRIVVQYKDA